MKKYIVHTIYGSVILILLMLLYTSHNAYRHQKKERNITQNLYEEVSDSLENAHLLSDSLRMEIGRRNYFLQLAGKRLGESPENLNALELAWIQFLNTQQSEKDKSTAFMALQNEQIDFITDSLSLLSDNILLLNENITSADEELEWYKLRIQELNDSLHTVFATLTDIQSVMEVIKITNAKGNYFWYLGQKNNGKAEGFGVALWPNGSTYKGYWKANQRHGMGTHIWQDGERYEGEFVEDRREGLGKYFWTNGEVYNGEWKDNKRNGQGLVSNANGKVLFEGIWVNDKLGRQTQLYSE